MVDEYHYTYYSYEEYGRGYIGVRTCKCLPQNDNYFGSFSDKTFKPNRKIILEIYDTREKAQIDEVILHNFFSVDINPHFANKAKQHTEKFYYKSSPEEAKKYGKRGELKLSIKDKKKGGVSTSSQKWKCTITNFIANPGNLTHYQKKHKIDVSNRIRIE
jgi:hypothetical protein